MRYKYLLALAPLVIGIISCVSLVGAQESIEVNATVAPYISVVFNYTTVDFGTLTAGTVDNYKYGGMVTIDTNADYKVEAYGSDFSDGAGHTFGISNLKLDAASTSGGLSVGDAVALSSSYVLIDTFSYSVTENHHGYWLSIPSGQYAAQYSTTIYIRYVNI